MKGKILWIIGIIEVIIGMAFYVTARVEIANNWRYTWTSPYTSYEMQVVMTKWIGLLLLVTGILLLGLKVYQTVYLNKHTQDVTAVTEKGGAIKCEKCGLMISANAEKCPKCGTKVHTEQKRI